MVRTLPDLLETHRASTGDRLVLPEGCLSYGALADASARVAGGLARLGVGRGDRVALWAENGLPWLSGLFACARLGAISVAVNAKFRSAEVADIVQRSGAKVMLTHGDDPVFAETLAACETLGSLHTVIWHGGVPELPSTQALDAVPFAALVNEAPLTSSDASPEAGCLIFTTSGSTSRPKFVLHAQERIVSHGRNVAAAAGIGPASVVFQFPPFCGTFGFSALFATLVPGARHVVPRTFSAAAAVDLCARHGVTHTMTTNDGLKALFDADADGTRLATLSYVGMAATNPLLGAMCAAAGARGITIASMYGSSEVQATFSLQPPGASAEDRALQGGRPVAPDARVRVTDPETGHILPHGEVGEIELLATESGMLGYFGDEAATAAAHRPDGYFRTGDFGYTQADGRFVFQGRMGDTLRLGGFLVDPREIESEVERLPGIAEAQVVAVTTARGLRPVAFIVPDGTGMAAEASMKERLAMRLAKFKLPLRFHVVEDFPRVVSANAPKVQKAKLRQMARTSMTRGPFSVIRRSRKRSCGRWRRHWNRRSDINTDEPLRSSV